MTVSRSGDALLLSPATASPSPTTRWALLVLLVADAQEDLATVEAWSGAAHVSKATMVNRCRAAGAAVKDSLTLGRVLRAWLRCERGTWRFEEAMATVDPRTIAGLLRRLRLNRHEGLPSLAALVLNGAWDIAEPARTVLLAELRRRRPGD